MCSTREGGVVASPVVSEAGSPRAPTKKKDRDHVAFLKDPWNRMDVYIVACGALLIFFEEAKWYTACDVMHVFLSLRPFRLVTRIPILGSIVLSLLRSLRSLGTMFGVLGFCALAFSIMGLQLFKGQFASCSDPEYPPGATWDLSQADGLPGSPPYVPCTNGTISSPFYNYDNIGRAMLSTFVIMAVDGWSSLLDQAMAANGIHTQPTYASNMSAFVYLGFGIMFFAFYMSNLFVGVVFESFLRIRGSAGADGDDDAVSTTLRRFQTQQARLYKVKPWAPVSVPSMYTHTHTCVCVRVCACVRACMFRVVHSEWFDRAVLFVIATNVAFLCLQYRGAPAWVDSMLNVGNFVFTACFTIEALLKIIALKCRYFRSYSNVFDFIVTVVGIFDVGVSRWPGCEGSSSMLLKIIRSLRVFRVVRLARSIPALRLVIVAIRYPLATLCYVILIIFLVIFVYASVGVLLFHGVALPLPYDRFANFQSYPAAMELLFIMSTGEQWSGTMMALVSNNPYHVHTDRVLHVLYPALASIYVVSFQILLRFLMVNMFVMVIVDTYETMANESHGLAEHLVPVFQEAWQKEDPKGTGYITTSQLYSLLFKLPPPLGLPKGATALDAHIRVIDMDASECVSFHDVLLGIHDYIFEHHHNREAQGERLAIIKAFAIVQRGVRRWMARRTRESFLRAAIQHRKRISGDRAPAVYGYQDDVNDGDDEEDDATDTPRGAKGFHPQSGGRMPSNMNLRTGGAAGSSISSSTRGYLQHQQQQTQAMPLPQSRRQSSQRVPQRLPHASPNTHATPPPSLFGFSLGGWMLPAATGDGAQPATTTPSACIHDGPASMPYPLTPNPMLTRTVPALNVVGDNGVGTIGGIGVAHLAGGVGGEGGGDTGTGGGVSLFASMTSAFLPVAQSPPPPPPLQPPRSPAPEQFHPPPGSVSPLPSPFATHTHAHHIHHGSPPHANDDGHPPGDAHAHTHPHVRVGGGDGGGGEVEELRSLVVSQAMELHRLRQEMEEIKRRVMRKEDVGGGHGRGGGGGGGGEGRPKK